ncbi:MAG: hypothetical protein FJZ01_03710 [Candidatus Sericytochromatia bacterium]|nr:hypothetical protein [Candidatus Tanganyikabacteria bacterium]
MSGGVGATNNNTYVSSGLVGADGKPREGWGLVDAPEVKPTDPGKLVEAPKFGDVEVPPTQPGVPSEIKPATEQPRKYESVPGQTVNEVKYTEPPPPPPSPRMIEVAGTGMGASKKFTMLESEALAVYRTIRDAKGNISPEDLAKKLKERYGIDAEVTTVDGKKAVVNKATGNTIAWDGNGNGSLDMSDMKLKEALEAAGIDPDWQANPKVFDLATKVVQQSIDASDKRRKEEEEAYQKGLAAKKVAAGAAAAGPAGTPETGATGGTTQAPAPVPVTPAPAPTVNTTAS